MKNRNWKIRSITAHDDSRVAYIIRSVMPEFGADGDGFAIHDAEVDWMSKAYNAPRSAYYVVELEGQVLGGGGIAPLEGATNPRICELRKMYFLPALRGLGAGQALLDTCLAKARDYGFELCYLETVVGMDSAMALYQKAGFRSLDKPMGDTGHGGCNRFFSKSL
ncbi:MAG: GNAT family N-acetyltransferase [Arenimonas sp.]|jgi:putative acetyltransferase|uniref:GNAT family N-acetyltransferase n=1 Tax=Arenimonas sp. TaxID=1872635 RepID=UPI001B4448FF|nr:GNAT family N-acetyltransferase [Arenimonas sp.]